MKRHNYVTLVLGLVAILAMAGAAAAQSPAGAQERALAGAAAQSQPGTQAPAETATPEQPAAQTKPKSTSDTTAKPKDPAEKPAKKVYTNEDLSGMGGVSVVGSKAPAKSGPTAANGPKNEQFWRSRAQQLHNQMAEVDRQIAQVEAANQNAHTATGSSNGSNPPPPSAYTVGAHVRGASGNTTQLERLKARKAQIQAQIDQLEDDARKANVPSDWVR